MTEMPAATREEIASVLGDVETSYIDRLVEVGASIDELGEAIDDLESRRTEPRHVASTTRVARVREILGELLDGNESPRTFPLRGTPVVGHPI